jgi:hypothetical protein
MPRYVNPVPQYFDSQGDILIEGFLRFDETGTNTLKPIWRDVNMTIPATNPVKLDGAGRVPSLFLSGAYKITAFKDDGLGSPGEQQWSRDPVGGESDAFGGDWSSATVYGIGDVVRGSDGEYYQSIINANSGNDPISVVTAWSLVNLLVNWNTNETYAQFDPVKGSDGNIYYSVIASNLGNNPTADDGTNWERGSTRPETAIQAQTTHNMASDADYTLTTSQAQKAIIKITDTGPVLTTGRNIIVPDAARAWIVDNSTAQILTLKTSAGTGVAVAAGVKTTVYSDGTNVVTEFSTVQTLSAGIKFGGGGDTLNHFKGSTAFTPTLTGGTTPGSATYSIQNGIWWRIGDLVFFAVDITLSAKGGLVGTVLLDVSDIGHDISSGSGFPLTIGTFQGLTFDAGRDSASVTRASATEFNFFESGSGVGASSITDAQITDAFLFSVSGFYKVA